MALQLTSLSRRCAVALALAAERRYVGQADMSFDIFVQDIPVGAKGLDDIPEDFHPQPIGRRDWVLDTIHRVAPEVTFAAPELGTIDLGGSSIEISIDADDPVTSFAFHVRGDERGLFLVADILKALGLRAFAPGTESGFFEVDQVSDAFSRWREFRHCVVRS
jgi:hypothetical protein